MALRLRSNFTRISNRNPNPKPHLPKSLSTTAPEPVDGEPPPAVKYLKTFVENLLTFDEAEEKKEKVREREKEEVEDEFSVRKRMLARMRDEWKMFKDRGWVEEKGRRDSSGEEEEEKMEESSGERMGEAEAELGEVREAVENVWSVESSVELVEEGAREQRSEGDAEMMGRKINDEKNKMFEELGKVAEKEGLDGSICWTSELGEVEESSVTVGNGNDGKGGRNPGLADLDDTLQMLKTKKNKLMGMKMKLKSVSKKSTMKSSNDEKNTRVGLPEGVNNEELVETLKKLENFLDEEKKQIKLNYDKALEDCLQKLHYAMVEEENQIRSKFDTAMREGLQKLQRQVKVEKTHFKTTFNELLMESYSNLHKQFREEKKRLVSSYNDKSTNSS